MKGRSVAVRGATVLSALALALVVAGCESGSAAAPTSTSRTITFPSPSPEGVAPPSPTPTVPAGGEAGGSAARGPIEAFDGSDADFERLNAVLDLPGDPVPAVAPLLASPDETTRFGAIYVVALLTDTPADIEALRPALADPVPGLRVIAAGALAGRGVVEALPVLIALLDAPDQLPYSRPPMAVAEHAWTVLGELTGETFATAAEWRAWWTERGGSLRWDGTRYGAD